MQISASTACGDQAARARALSSEVHRVMRDAREAARSPGAAAAPGAFGGCRRDLRSSA